MSKRIVFATHNKHKLNEVKAIAGHLLDIVGLEEIGCSEDIPETAATLEGNALLKARYVKEKYGYDCFADDTGLEIKSLNNEPGVYSARYAGEPSDPEKNVKKVLTLMQDTEDREARFRTVIALITDEETLTFEGIIKGAVIGEKRGNSGFGYDPIFVPDGHTLTFAEMGETTKNSISHRAVAMNKFTHYLAERNKQLKG